MHKKTFQASRYAVAFALMVMTLGWVWAGPDRPTRFSNQGSISNTRHNMTQRVPGLNNATMDPARNDYGEVCVYCHTPHGSSNVALPLWNRTITSTTYTTYDALNSSTLTQPVTQPGINSLACLSCHDGQTAIDSIINMPGSGRSNPAQATTQDNAFLDTWPGSLGGHGGLDSGGGGVACLSCHSPGNQPAATDFTAFYIGTDLRNDHPIGITFPTNAGPGTEFNEPGTIQGNLRWFDFNGNGRADKQEVRLYDTGDGFEVECGTCHDPHGVPTAGAGSTFIPTFLRVSNTGSGLCLTCHNK